MTHEAIQVSTEIKLEQLKLEDAELLFGLIDNDREHLSRFLPWPERTKTVDDSRTFVRHMLRQRAEGEEYGYAINYDNMIIGHISLMHLKQRPEIGYWIASSYGGKGITTRVTNALTDFAFGTLGLNSILIRADPNNTASNKVAQKCGYRLQGMNIDESGKQLNEWTRERV